jgi:hypothetical protein
MDRADLLKNPTEGDHCNAFVEGEPGNGQCDTDGHYLCGECKECSQANLHRLGKCSKSILLCEECDEEDEAERRTQAHLMISKANALEAEAKRLRKRAQLIWPE